MIPTDTQDLLNAEIARRDAIPAFVASLSKAELVVRNQDLERLVQRLTKCCLRAASVIELQSPSLAINIRADLKKALV